MIPLSQRGEETVNLEGTDVFEQNAISSVAVGKLRCRRCDKVCAICPDLLLLLKDTQLFGPLVDKAIEDIESYIRMSHENNLSSPLENDKYVR